MAHRVSDEIAQLRERVRRLEKALDALAVAVFETGLTDINPDAWIAGRRALSAGVHRSHQFNAFNGGTIPIDASISGLVPRPTGIGSIQMKQNRLTDLGLRLADVNDYHE